MRKLPTEERGYPIPFVTMIDTTTGKPDFRVLDLRRQILCIRHRQCAMCGEVLGKFIAFIGGPLCGVNRVFVDPGMHRECAEFAAKVCPFISREDAQYRDISEADLETLKRLNIVTDTLADDDRSNPEMYIYITEYYKPVRVDNASVAAHAAEFIEVIKAEQTRSAWR